MSFGVSNFIVRQPSACHVLHCLFLTQCYSCILLHCIFFKMFLPLEHPMLPESPPSLSPSLLVETHRTLTHIGCKAARLAALLCSLQQLSIIENTWNLCGTPCMGGHVAPVR